MADNRLRCALVYRLDAGDETSVTMLAKYDHASQYETSPGGSDLYGGRDKSYADAVGMVIGNDPPGATSEAGTIGGFKVCQSEVHQVVYGSDTDGLCKLWSCRVCSLRLGLGARARTDSIHYLNGFEYYLRTLLD